MIDITTRLESATLDKDNFPRMDSERQVPVGLAKEAKAEIERLRAAQMKWQPIESAPKDGNDILVYMFGNSMAVVYYDHEETSEYPWKTMDGPGYHRDAPTHWMSLPEPPCPDQSQNG